MYCVPTPGTFFRHNSLISGSCQPSGSNGRHEWPCVHFSMCAIRTLSQIEERSFVVVVIQIQAILECPHWWNILLHDSEADDAVAPGQTDWHVFKTNWLRRTSDTACGFWFLLTPFDLQTVFREKFAPVAAPRRVPLGYQYPTEHLQGQGRRRSRWLQERKVFVPWALPARRSYFSSMRRPRFPSGHSRAQCQSLRHLAHLVRSFSC